MPDNPIIIVGNQEFVSIIPVPLFHIQLSLSDVMTISWTLEFDTKAVVFKMDIHDHNVRLTFHVTFAVTINSCLRGVLVFTKSGKKDCTL